MLIPYNVDRPARKIPWVTYTLIGINVFAFLITILIANVNLPSNRILAKGDQIELFQDFLTPDSYDANLVAAIRVVFPDVLPLSSAETAALNNVDEIPMITPQQQQEQEQVRTQFTTAQARQLIWALSMKLASENMAKPNGYDRFWRIQHMNDTVVWEPDYSMLSWMAYHPDEP